MELELSKNLQNYFKSMILKLNEIENQINKEISLVAEAKLGETDEIYSISLSQDCSKIILQKNEQEENKPIKGKNS